MDDYKFEKWLFSAKLFTEVKNSFQ